MIKKGMKVRIVPTERGHKLPEGQSRRTEKVGVIESVTARLLTIRTKNYLMTFNIADILIPYDYYLAIWNGERWKQVYIDNKVTDLRQITI